MVLGAVAFVAMAHAVQDSSSDQKRLTDAKTGVQIVLEVDADMFPQSWKDSPINAKAKPLEPGEVGRSAKLVQSALAIYPPEVLKSDLRKVFVCRSIDFYGLTYGGTNSFDTVYLTNNGTGLGYTDSYITGSFHHEFSSILKRNHPTLLDERAWNGANPPEFKYGHGGTEALRMGQASTRLDVTLAGEGFVAQYAKASVEEDFNMVVEGLFSGNPEFWKMVDGHSRLKVKMALAVKFYKTLNPIFTESFFRSKPASS